MSELDPDVIGIGMGAIGGKNAGAVDAGTEVNLANFDCGTHFNCPIAALLGIGASSSVVAEVVRHWAEPGRVRRRPTVIPAPILTVNHSAKRRILTIV